MELGVAPRTSPGCSIQRESLLWFTLQRGKLNYFYTSKPQKIQITNLHISKPHRIASIPGGVGLSTARHTPWRRAGVRGWPGCTGHCRRLPPTDPTMPRAPKCRRRRVSRARHAGTSSSCLTRPCTVPPRGRVCRGGR